MKNYELTDTHSHLYLDDFGADIDECLARAKAEGVNRIYLPSLDSQHWQSVIDLENKYPERCFAMAGIHPCYVDENYLRELDFLKTSLTERRYVAIGEIGLDYFWDKTFQDNQMICFREQIKLAKQYQLPIVIHSRSSMDEIINVLKEEKDHLLRGIFHCFSGNIENAMDIIGCGLVLGIGGVITYKNAGLAEVVAQVPLENIVLETDAPYLTPVPFRGKRNESSYLKYIAEKLALVKNVSVEEVAAVTTANAKRVFG